MNLNLAWTTPSPLPTCGYKALYRRKADPTYTEIDTSGTTLTLVVEAPASYEGNIVSDCCAGTGGTSSGTPFGVNAYQALNVSASISGTVLTVSANSHFGNSYDVIVTATANWQSGSTPHSITQQGTYPAGSTSGVIFHWDVAAGSTVDANGITDVLIGPIFTGGGQLQQLDSVNTPPYFGFYWSGNISGSTWDGSPLSLPSFTLDAFTPTELSPDGLTILAGNLNLSYIADQIFSNAFTSLSLEVYDATSAFVGSTIISKTPLGLRTATITLTKATSPLTSATQFTVQAVWPDLTVIETKTFFLP
jgi:hypothetical protein